MTTYFFPKMFLKPTTVFFAFFTSWGFAWFPMYWRWMDQYGSCLVEDRSHHFLSVESQGAGNLTLSILVSDALSMPLLLQHISQVLG